MKIGIDARFYGSVGKGLGRYVSELIRHLEMLDTENEYIIFLRDENWHEYKPKNPRFVKVRAEYPWYSWKEHLLFPLLLRRHHLDLLHVPHFNVPLFYRRPFIVTVHDLILLSHPSKRATTLGPLRYRIKYAAYRIVIGSALHRAKEILTVSEYSKRHIRRAFPKTRQTRISVTYPAGNTIAEQAEEETEKTTHIPKPFMLYVGSSYPHKNVEGLIESFILFRNMHPEYHLLIVGGKDYFSKQIEQKTGDPNIHFFGHATDGELKTIYRHATAFVFPSLAEGFGIPPIEAMLNGTPVISSNAGCMPEILGNGAYYADATNAQALADAMSVFADNPHSRKEYAERGIQQAQTYNWKSLAKETHDAYLRHRPTRS